MTAAIATASQRTTRPATRWSRGSKSSAMRAVGTVSAVYREPVVAADGTGSGVSAGRHLPCHPLGRPPVTARTSSAQLAVARGRAASRGATRGGGSWGVRRLEPGARPMGGRAGRRRPRRDGYAWHDAEPHRVPSCRWTCWAGSTSEPPPGCGSTFAGRHAPALFALLVLVRRPRSREAIAADLWPESDTTSAGSLRQALWLVRHGLSDAGLPPDSRARGLDGVDRRPRRCDHRARHRRLRGVPRRPRCGAERAIGLYGGDLVESLGHDCFAAERERLADRYEDALVTVAERRLADGDLRGASEAAQRVIARDPLREEAHAILIAVHGLVGIALADRAPVPPPPGRPRARARRTAAPRDRCRVPAGDAPRRPALDGARRAGRAGPASGPRGRQPLGPCPAAPAAHFANRA